MAAVKIQKAWRGYWVRKVKQARTPGLYTTAGACRCHSFNTFFLLKLDPYALQSIALNLLIKFGTLAFPKNDDYFEPDYQSLCQTVTEITYLGKLISGIFLAVKRGHKTQKLELE